MTLETYTAAVRSFLKQPDMINEAHFVEACMQKWCGRPARFAAYSDRSIRQHASGYEASASDAIPATDRKRKMSPRTQ